MNILGKGLLMASFALLAGSAHAQTWNDLKNKGKDLINKNTNNNKGGGGSVAGLSQNEIVQGLKEALNVGTKNSANKLSALNGYFGNQLIKILMPPEAKKIESTLRSLGMGNVVDKAITSMNRAAEDAATKSVPIFLNAITSMTIQDGVSILRGGSGAATNYLKGRTTAQLTTAFRPVIDQSLGKVGATKYWRELTTIYNQLPTVRQKINPDLGAYVTERALNGLFVTIAEEENKIRTNPAARISDILKKVFGAK
jgi:hypothetical protein